MGFASAVFIFGLLSLWSPQQAPSPRSICGTVQDQTGALVVSAAVELSTADTRLDTKTDAGGRFCFTHVASGQHDLIVQSRGFHTSRQKVTLREGESVNLTISLSLEAVAQQVTVAEGSADVGSLNVAQTRISSGLLQNLPSESVNAALSSILTLATPGVAADSNGVFHPLGEHHRRYEDPPRRSSGRVWRQDQSHRGSDHAFGLERREVKRDDFDGLRIVCNTYGKRHSCIRLSHFGNFVALDGVDSHRFLDTPEFQPLHARGNAESLFDRFDWRPSDATSFHLNLSAARSWFQVPNTYDQQTAGQDQRQHMTSFNVAPAFSRILSPALLLTANAWVRQDRVNYFPSANLFSDQPATLSQSRRLTSTGLRSDLTYSRGRQTMKGGVQVQVTPLSEAFSTGLTDPAFNSPCVGADGAPVADSSLTSPSQCAGAGYAENASYQPSLLPYDLTRGGTLFQFRGGATIYEGSAYFQDSIKFGQLALTLGLRYDNYHGLSKGSGVQPRTGIAYRVRATGTVLHVSYARVFLTPYNENLVLSSATGPGGLANGSLGATKVQPLIPARRNQFNVGLEQQLGPKLSVQAEYFWKFTSGAYDFNSILNTPLNFPIQFRKSKIDGALVRVTLNNVHGFSAFTVMGHSRSRLFSPEIGGINFGAAYAPVARPDHDQGFEQTTNLQYQFSQKGLGGLWLGLTWRFDSGLVVVSVPDYVTALTLAGDEQQEIGLYCGKQFATVAQPLRGCSAPHYGATLIHIVPPGTYNADTNPSRIMPRNLFDIAVGADSLWKKDTYSLGGKITVVNLTNKAALYNFLSSFSGTHFVAPRTVQAEITFHF